MKKSLIFTNLEWKHLFDVFTDPVFLLDNQNNILECSSSAVDIYGYSKDEFGLMNLFDIRAPYTRADIESSMENTSDGNVVVFETTHIKKDRSEFNVEVSTRSFFSEGEHLFLHTVRDITKRRKAEEELVKSEKRYHSLVDFSPITIFIQCDNKILYVNPAGTKLFGAQNEDQITGRSVFDFIHPDYHRITAYRINLLREGMSVPLIEERILRLDGSSLDVEVTAKPIMYMGFPSVEVFMQDITIRKQSQKLSLFLASIVESSLDAIITCSMDSVITYWNKGAEKIYGFKSEDVTGKPLMGLIPISIHDRIPVLLEKIAAGETIENYTRTFLKSDSSIMKVNITVSPIKNPEGEITGASFITRKINSTV